jgi:putative chitinase
MELSQAAIKQLYPRAPAEHVQEFARGCDAVFDLFQIRGGHRLQFFLAQVGHESGGLSIAEENLNYRAERICIVWPTRFPTLELAQACAGSPEALANTVYANRMGNGDFQSGDGWRFRGRGYIQLTGRGAYSDVGAIAGLDLVGAPDLACDPRHALMVAASFWKWKALNQLCDAGDFQAVTRRINGGLNGFDDRRAWLDKVRRVLAVPPSGADQPAAADVVAIQRALRAHGYIEVGAADGIIGPRTLAAVERFRVEHNLGPGGIDPALQAALGHPLIERALEL